jgi:hypothetical protein
MLTKAFVGLQPYLYMYESVVIQVDNVETRVLACGHALLTSSYENKHMFRRQRC